LVPRSPAPKSGQIASRYPVRRDPSLPKRKPCHSGTLPRGIENRELALELVCGADFWCNRHCKKSPLVLEGFWGQVWPKFGRKPAHKTPARLPSGAQVGFTPGSGLGPGLGAGLCSTNGRSGPDRQASSSRPGPWAPLGPIGANREDKIFYNCSRFLVGFRPKLGPGAQRPRLEKCWYSRVGPVRAGRQVRPRLRRHRLRCAFARHCKS
jgi:hypothetical protein